jgi:hypothetical protein
MQHLQEARTGIIELPEEDPYAVEVMMYYLYHLDYPTVLPSFDVVEPSLQLNGLTLTPISNLANHPSEVPIEEVSTTKFTTSPFEDFDDSGDMFAKSRKLKMARKTGLMWDYQAEEEVERLQKLPPLGLTLHAKVFALAEMHGVACLKDLALLRFRYEAREHWDADAFLQAAEIAYIDTVEEVREMREAVVEVFHGHHTLLREHKCKHLLKRLPDLSYDMLVHVCNNS